MSVRLRNGDYPKVWRLPCKEPGRPAAAAAAYSILYYGYCMIIPPVCFCPFNSCATYGDA